MSNFCLKTPVVFLIFNRLHTTAQVFEAIRQAKPRQLLVVPDVPRPNKQEDVEKCHSDVTQIEKLSNKWDCEVSTNYSDINLGCENRVPVA